MLIGECNMKEVEITLTELTKEETLKVKPQEILIYNRLTNSYRVERNDARNFIGKSKYTSDKLVYFSFVPMEELKGE